MGLLQRSSLRFKEFSLGRLVVGSSLIKKNEQLPKWSLVLTRCTTSCHSLSLVVTLYHSLSLVAIRCHSLYHSLSLVVPPALIRCHSLSFGVTRCTTHCHSLSLEVPLACLFINDLKNLIKKEDSGTMFSCEFGEISHNTFFKELFGRLLLHKHLSSFQK